MAELLLSCQDLGKSFGSAPLFEGLSFGVFEGDHIGLVGPNGSGKTTLLKILAGLEEPSTGTRAARKRLRFGFVAQDPTFDALHADPRFAGLVQQLGIYHRALPAMPDVAFPRDMDAERNSNTHSAH